MKKDGFMRFSRFVSFTIIALPFAMLAACAPTQQKTPVIVMGDAPSTPPFVMDSEKMAAAFSNENVIVYPVDGDIADNRREFPEYRGVMENTTAGGYTVFDPSVAVFAVEGEPSVRPSYLPEYSVPQYAEQYRAMSTPIDNQPEAYSDQGGPLMPIAVVPRAPNTGTVANGGTRRPWLETERLPAPSATPQSPYPQQARRSPPMLTGY